MHYNIGEAINGLSSKLDGFVSGAIGEDIGRALCAKRLSRRKARRCLEEDDLLWLLRLALFFWSGVCMRTSVGSVDDFGMSVSV